MAAEKGVTAAQLATAWVLAKNPSVIAVMGASTRVQLDETLGALALRLNREDLARLESAVPAGSVAGTRYPAPMMAHLDSER
jgi:aryl-alcohol dehydrogenase-like predicted oxidoreductase